LAIGHAEKGGHKVLDCIREVKPPFSPDDVVREFSDLLKTYKVTLATGDRYAGEWPVERFKVHGIRYEQSAKPKSDLYAALLPDLNSGRRRLLHNKRLISQLASLESRTSRAGRDSIDHGPNGHDDVANAVAGLFAGLQRSRGSGRVVTDIWGDRVFHNSAWTAEEKARAAGDPPAWWW
jgi:hypothetical protein